MIMSKTKVSPLKNIMLPRLELQAAVLATRLTTFILSALKWQGTIHLWSDSQIVLCWINSSKKLTPFVSHRIAETTNSFAANKWHYCPSADNPADLLTRGITSQQLTLSKLWKHGPTWLTSRELWPIKSNESHPLDITAVLDNSQVNVAANDVGLHQIIILSDYSTLARVLRITAYVLRFVHNCRHPQTLLVGALSTTEQRKANLKWVLNTQQQVFSKEIANIRSKSKRSFLVRQLRLFIDSSGALRCGGGFIMRHFQNLQGFHIYCLLNIISLNLLFTPLTLHSFMLE